MNSYSTTTMFSIQVILVTILVSMSSSEEHNQKVIRNSGVYKNCNQSYSTTCLKLEIASWVDKFDENANHSLFGGISIVRDTSNSTSRSRSADIVADLAKEFPNDSEARLDAFLLRKVQDFISSHSIKVNFDQENIEEARRRKNRGGNRNAGMMLALGAMMKGMLMALALGALAALSGKALMVGLISLMLSAIVGLKSLSGSSGKTTYEVVSKPVYSHSNSHSASYEDYHHGSDGHSGYARSFELPLPLTLQKKYKPK